MLTCTVSRPCSRASWSLVVLPTSTGTSSTWQLFITSTWTLPFNDNPQALSYSSWTTHIHSTVCNQITTGRLSLLPSLKQQNEYWAKQHKMAMVGVDDSRVQMDSQPLEVSWDVRQPPGTGRAPRTLSCCQHHTFISAYRHWDPSRN